MTLPSTYQDPNTLDLVFDDYLTQPIYEGVVGNLLWIGGTTGGLHAGSSAQVGTLQQLWLENLGAGGSRWVADVGNNVGSAQNELFIGRFHTGTGDGWAGTQLQPSLILYNDLSDIRTIFTDKTGTFKFSISPTNNAADPGHPWLRTDGQALTINSRPTQVLYLNLDTGSMVAVQGQLRVDNANTNGGTLDLILGTGSEGIGSKRTAGGNQGGLDLYTAGSVRLAVTNAGLVQIGGQPATRGTGSGQRMVQSGITSATSLNSTAQSVTFPTAFAATPVVTQGLLCGTSTAPGHLVSAVSSTGATLNYFNNGGTPQSIQQMWIAEGQS